MEKLFIAMYVLFHNHNSKKYYRNLGKIEVPMVIIPSGLEIFRTEKAVSLN